MNVKDSELLTLLNNCFRDSAKNWLYLVDNKIKNFEDFEKVFRERFWNEPIQSHMQARFEIGKFVRNGNISRVSYAQ